MSAVSEAKVPARSIDGSVLGYLRIALLPRASSAPVPPLVDASEIEESDIRAPVQLLEGYEYLYEWVGLPNRLAVIATDPEEAFQPDSLDGRKGRLRPGLSTGTLQVVLRNGEATLGRLELEVRSRKLNYMLEYRWMLRDIASQMTELVMDRFAISSASFTHDSARDAVTLYQRFAFLRSLFMSESFQVALHEVTRRPHVSWEDQHEVVSPGQPIRASSHTQKQLARHGMRTAWPDGPIGSIPVRLYRRRTEATHDTTPNRFVRFALERWRQVVADIERRLSEVAENTAVARGRREVAQTLEQLDTVLNHDLFKDLGPLARFPADDQVLQRREGYRDVFRAYLEFEIAAQLSWRGSESSYEAGQRDVATLYEYWAFLQLAQVVAKLAGQTFSLKSLIEMRSDGLNVVLQTGKETVLSGSVERHGRKMAIELCFNRTYRQGKSQLGSWTRPMRPDYSLIVTAPEGERAAFEPVVLHFDAKYRVDFVSELFGFGDEIVNTDELPPLEPELQRGSALRADLLKMHAYRDAIRRSAGAYVLFPGSDDPSSRAAFKEYHELLPGLGAFALRPSQEGDAMGISALRVFLDQVFDHVATRLTQHERGRYWLEEVYGEYEVPQFRPTIPKTVQPGAETTVLLGYVKSSEHWEWIQKTKAYNVRTESRRGGLAQNAEALYCQLLFLYCPDIGITAVARIVSAPELVLKSAMEATGYPNASSDYLCIQLSWLAPEEYTLRCRADAVDRFVQGEGRLRGEPTVVRWAELEKLDETQN